MVIGHVTRDQGVDGDRPGGTVTYSGRMAQALGYRTAVLTSARDDYDLRPIFDGIELCTIPSDHDAVFLNIYDGNERVQLLHSKASNITAADLPTAWTDAKIVHLGPLTNEVDPAIIDLFPTSLIGITPQGWMRRWGDDRRVWATSFPAEEMLLKKADVTILSTDDFVDDAMRRRYIRWANILVVTQNAAGCTVYTGGKQVELPAPKIKLVEPTGAGDIFATAFLIELQRSGRNPVRAAEFANHVAAHSVTQTDLAKKVEAWRKIGS